MVDRDMVRRLRPLLVALATVSLLVLVSPSPAPAEAAAGALDGHAAVTVTKASVVRPAPERAVRPHPSAAVALALVALLTAGAALGARPEGLIGRYRRRLGDVGEDWRALLLGAPPAVA
jgi:hypothetical protein